MRSDTSFHAAGVPPEQLGAILGEYWALERLRDVRREYLPLLATLAAAALALNLLGVMSPIECEGTVAAISVASLWVCTLEFLRERRLVHHLAEVRGRVTRIVRRKS